MQTEPPKADSPKRSIRWFQFSLRTLLIGVTLLAVPCAYVGWKMKIISERHEVAAKYRTWTVIRIVHDNPGITWERRKAPWPLSWMGEEGVFQVDVPTETATDEVSRLKQLFPEAIVRRNGIGPPL